MSVAGLTKVTSGEIRLDGTPICGPSEALGVAFQTDALVDWRTVLGNVLLQFELRGQRSKKHAPRAMELLQSVGLGGFESKRPYELSGGMRQRVAICRSLIHDPSLLLMDEPFGALDAFTRDQMMQDLQTLWMETRKTIMFVTHSISEAVFLADRVFVMTPRPGRLEEIIKVDLPRPRTLETLATAEFNEHVQQIRNIFNAQGVPA
jgi:NitT/TauT family transport system ATP-binding protein